MAGPLPGAAPRAAIFGAVALLLLALCGAAQGAALPSLEKHRMVVGGAADPGGRTLAQTDAIESDCDDCACAEVQCATYCESANNIDSFTCDEVRREGGHAARSGGQARRRSQRQTGSLKNPSLLFFTTPFSDFLPQASWFTDGSFYCTCLATPGFVPSNNINSGGGGGGGSSTVSNSAFVGSLGRLALFISAGVCALAFAAL